MVTPQFQEFFRLGRVLRTTLPTAQGGVVHLFVVYGYQGAEEDAEKLRLTDRLLQAVLAEAQVVCVGQPMLIAGDLNADPAVIPCLAKGISAGRYVDLALAYSLGAGLTLLILLVRLIGMMVLVLVGIFLWCVRVLLLVLKRVVLLIGGSFLTFLFLLAFVLVPGWLMLLARSSSSSSRVVQDVWDIYRDVLGVVPDDVVLALRDAASRSADPFGVKMLRQVYLGHMLLLEVLLLLAALPFLEEVCYVFVAGVWEAELLVAWLLAGCIGSVMLMRLMSTVLSSLSTLLFLPCYSFVGVSNLLQMFLRVFGVKGSLSLVGMLYFN